MKKILFINIYPNSIACYTLAAYVLKAYAYKDEFIKSNYAIDIINCSNNHSFESDVQLYDLAKKYDIICYSVYTWNIHQVKRLNSKIGENKVCVFGGPEIAGNNIEVAPNAINYYIVGQGELKFVTLLHYLLSSENEKNVNSIWEAEEKEEIVETTKVYSSEIIPSNLYKHRIAYIETQRGCYYRCSYCNYGKNLRRINYFDINVILDEIAYIIKIGIKEIRFIDPVFTSDIKRANLIIDKILELKKEGYAIPQVFVETEWEMVDSAFIEKMSLLKKKEAICNTKEVKNLNIAQVYTSLCKNYNELISIGIQSFNNNALRAVNRKIIDVKKFEQFMMKVINKNVLCKLDMILGLPCETYMSFWDGIEYICQFLHNNDIILNIHILKIVPNTVLYGSYQQYGIIVDENTGNVLETNVMRRNDMIECEALIAVLLRLINSSLRSVFLTYCKDKSIKIVDALLLIMESLPKQLQIKIANLSSKEGDDYWNTSIYRDLTYEMVLGVLKA